MRYFLHTDRDVVLQRTRTLEDDGFRRTDGGKPGAGEFRVRQSPVTKVFKVEWEPKPEGSHFTPLGPDRRPHSHLVVEPAMMELRL